MADQDAIIESALDFATECAQVDIQAHKVLHVIGSFKQTVDQYLHGRSNGYGAEPHVSSGQMIKEEDISASDSSSGQDTSRWGETSFVQKGRNESISMLPHISDMSRAPMNFSPPVQLSPAGHSGSGRASPSGHLSHSLPAAIPPTISAAGSQIGPQQGLHFEGLWSTEPSHIYPRGVPERPQYTLSSQSFLSETEVPIRNHSHGSGTEGDEEL